MTKRISRIQGIIALLAFSLPLLAACAPQPTAAPADTPAAAGVPGETPDPTATTTRSRTPTITPIPLPAITLPAGGFYFRVDGESAFLFSRNPAGINPADFESILAAAARQGDRFLRLTVATPAMGGDHGFGYNNKGEILKDWSDHWEDFFDKAEAKGVYVLPVLTTWYDWNATGYNTWTANPFNAANGGPADHPREFFRKDSPTQLLFMKMVERLVKRWRDHKNILAWEAFSEINNIQGISQTEGIYLAGQLYKTIKAADGSGRPVSTSLADWGNWDSLLRSDAVDFIGFHPYPADGKMDRHILQEVARLRSAIGKPVLIGESGLHFATPDSAEGKITVAEKALTGLRHAVWAELVSGAMNGRALWWEDGVGIYFPALGMPWVRKYDTLETAMVRFSARVDLAGFQPLRAAVSGKIFGGAAGNEAMILGWFRDAKCEPPDWPAPRIAAGQTVTLTVPGTAAEWKVDFYSTQNGADVIGSVTVTRKGGAVTITLPEFSDDIAFKASARK